MAREIKFRAWHKKKMHHIVLVQNEFFYVAKIMAGSDLMMGIDFSEQLMVSDDSESKLMQYTGLKDKNDKEIFEGDIYVLNSNNGTGVVKWDENGYYVGRFCIDGTGEVIGNIHQNKSILKLKKS